VFNLGANSKKVIMTKHYAAFWLSFLSLNWADVHGQNVQKPFGSITKNVSGQQIINESLRGYIGEVMEKYDMPGMALGIIRSNGEVELEGFGLKNEDGDPVTPEVCKRISINNSI
jgi:hypothetical protein